MPQRRSVCSPPNRTETSQAGSGDATARASRWRPPRSPADTRQPAPHRRAESAPSPILVPVAEARKAAERLRTPAGAQEGVGIHLGRWDEAVRAVDIVPRAVGAGQDEGKEIQDVGNVAAEVGKRAREVGTILRALGKMVRETVHPTEDPLGSRRQADSQARARPGASPPSRRGRWRARTRPLASSSPGPPAWPPRRGTP